jgi:hypothetical protein
MVMGSLRYFTTRAEGDPQITFAREGGHLEKRPSEQP